VKAEMQWYVRYMEHFEKRASDWADLDLGNGYNSYARRQADMWRRMGLEGRHLFEGKAKLPLLSPEVDGEEPIE
jgi:hypothetical protein